MYTAGNTMTVTLEDAQENPVTGQAAVLKDAVKVQGAEDEQLATWTEKEDAAGTYTAEFTAKEAGEGHMATLSMADWEKQSEHYTIRQADEIIGLTTDGYSFKPDEGFPTTGYDGASFTIDLRYDNPDEFNWSSSSDRVVVTQDGVVTLKDSAVGEVKITGNPKSPTRSTIEYTFVINRWFKQEIHSTSDTPENICARTGMEVAQEHELMAGPVRGTGTFGTEWGFESVVSMTSRVDVNFSSGSHVSIIPSVVIGGTPGGGKLVKLRMVTGFQATSTRAFDYSNASGDSFSFKGPVLCQSPAH